MNRSSSGELSTIIGQDASLDGYLKVNASMRIDGRIKGELESADTVTIGDEGSVEGNITAQDIIIGGKVVGRIIANGKVVLESRSILNGDLKAARLVVEEGATFNGCSDMGGSQKSSPANLPPRQITLDNEE